MYVYREQRESLFTEQGQVLFLKIRDRVNDLIKLAGSVRMQEAIAECTGSSWAMLACVDRLVELGEIVEVTGPNVFAQHRIFTKKD